jgi:hypothetical protein
MEESLPSFSGRFRLAAAKVDFDTTQRKLIVSYIEEAHFSKNNIRL